MIFLDSTKFIDFLLHIERTQTGKAVARQDPNFKDGRPKKFTPEQLEVALSLLEQERLTGKLPQ